MYLQSRSQHHSPVLVRFHPPKADPTRPLPSSTLPSSARHHLASISADLPSLDGSCPYDLCCCVTSLFHLA